MADQRTETDRRGISHPQFIDLNNRRWTIALDFEVYRRVLSNHEVDLCDLVYPDQKCLRQLVDPMILVDVLWEIVAEQAHRDGIREEQFAKSLDMTILAEAQRKLIDEMIFFSRSHPRVAIVREAIAAADKAEERARQEVMQALPKIRKQMNNSVRGVSDGDLLASSASTRADGPSGNSPGPQSSGSESGGTTPRRSSPKTRRSTATPSDARHNTGRKSSTRLRT